MDKKQKRLNVTISFSNKNTTYEENVKVYNYVKCKPNSSYYIRELVEKEMKGIQRKEKDTSFTEKVDVNSFVNSVFNI